MDEIVKVVVFNQDFWPYANKCAIHGLTRNAKCLEPGMECEMLGHILHKANITYELTSMPSDTGDYVNSSWTGLLGRIFNGEIHTMASTYMGTKLREEFFDFTYPVEFDQFVFLYKNVDDSFAYHINSILKPFSTSVWMSFASICLTLLLIWQCARRSTKIWEFFLLLFGQSLHVPKFATFSGGLLFVMLSLLVLLFQTFYQNTILLNFLNSDLPVAFSSTDELIELLNSGRLKVITENNDWPFFESLELGQTTDKGSALKTAILSKSNLVLIEEGKDVNGYLRTGKYVYPNTLSLAQITVSTECDLTYFKIEDMPLLKLSYVFRKNFTRFKLIDKAIRESSAMIEYYVNKYYKLMDERSLCDKRRRLRRHEHLTILEFSGPIMLLFVGAGVGLIILLIEKIRVIALNYAQRDDTRL